MNKSQINYFCEKMNIVCARAVKSIEDRVKLLPGPSIEEIVGAISSGKARFRSEIFSGPECPHIRSNPKNTLTDIFELPGEDVRQSKNVTIVAIITDVVFRIRSEAEKAKDDFVMGDIPDPRTHLAWFEAHDFLTSDEKKKLRKLGVGL